MATSPVEGIQGKGLGISDFLKILTTQLRFQDPLKPMDNQAFIAQLAQFSALQQAQETNTRLNDLSTTEATLQSIGLIGKFVDVRTGPTTTETAKVNAIELGSGVPLLTVTTTPSAGNPGSVLRNVSLGQVALIHN